MADDGKVEAIITLFPDEIAATLGSVTISSDDGYGVLSTAYKTASYEPADVNDKWYYRLYAVGTGTGGDDMISGQFLESTDTVATTDKVKFLYIENEGAALVYLTIDGSAAAAGGTSVIEIKNGEWWFAKFTNNVVGNIHAISASGSVNCIVAAIIDDL
jgi:hypothetical protein|tara:strand:- start:4673 stop:5149 length:477 start_codon:yes stop_codon:yes gene_type:complete